MKVSLRKWETNKNSVSVNYGPLSFSLRITENYRRMNSERAAQDDSKWQASADPAKWPAYEITPGSKWNYGLVLTDKPLAQQFEVVRRPYPGGGFPWSAEAVPLVLKVKGDLIPGWAIDQYGLCGVLPQSPVDVEDGAAAGQGGPGQGGGSGVQTIELIPMGAARLRISSFPVVNLVPRKKPPVVDAKPVPPPTEWIEVLKPEGANIFDTTGGVQVIARGFKWTEGPLYVPAGGGGGGAGDYLLFSDVPHNKIYKWKRNGDTSVFLMPSGFTGTGVKEREPGSNGLLYDKYSGSLLLMQQGDRRVAKMDAPLNAAAPKFVVLADHYKGKRLNSPNDGVLAPDGGIYFTDPPYGLDGLLADTAKELTFQGVFYIRADHRLALVTDELKYPNGIALSPDGKTLYVNNSDSLDRRWMKYGLGEDGLIKDKHVFFQYSGVERGNPDGMKVNKAGYVFSAGPGGLWVFNPAGMTVARVHVGQLVSNCAFGKDGKELFITATDRVLRVGLR
jgi:gluconolactonase